MTIADFLYQAGFWQWIGIIVLAWITGMTIEAFAKGLGNFRFSDRHDNSTSTWNTTNNGEKKP